MGQGGTVELGMACQRREKEAERKGGGGEKTEEQLLGLEESFLGTVLTAY